MTQDTINVQRGVVSAGADFDTYVLAPNLIEPGAEITISDGGSNRVQLIGGLEIVSSQVANDGLRLVLNNGATVTVLDAAGYEFETGGNPLLGVSGVRRTFEEFSQEVLGVAVPGAGLPPVDGGSGILVNDDGTFSGNNAPVATDDFAVVDEDDSVSIDVLANDSDANGDALSVVSASAANGSVSIEADGTLTYAPDPDFNGDDVIAYEISDGRGGSAAAEVAVTVAPVNDAPVVASDSMNSGDEDSLVAGTVAGAVSDVDGDDLTFARAPTQVPVPGMEFAEDGSFVFDAGHAAYQDLAQGETRDVTFDYVVTDGNGGSATGRLIMTVTGADEAATVEILTVGPDSVDLPADGVASRVLGARGTLNAGDVITGGDEDSVIVRVDGADPADFAGFELDGVGTLQVTNDAAGPATFDLSSSNGVRRLVSENSTGDVRFDFANMNDDGAGGQELGLRVLNLTEGVNVTLDIRSVDQAGENDTVDLVVTDSDDDALDANEINIVADSAKTGADPDDSGVETVNLDTDGSAGEVRINDLNTPGVETLNISTANGLVIGDADATDAEIENALSSTVTRVDAGASTGSVSLSTEDSAGDVSVTGGSASDRFELGGTNDTLFGGDGDDTVTAAGGANEIHGEGGSDDITAGAGDDTIDGGEGDNAIVAGDGLNVIAAGSGNDTITGGRDADDIDVVGGDNVIVAGAGADMIDAGAGNDDVDAGDGDDEVRSGDGDDTVDAGAGDDLVVSGGGADSVAVGDGNDTVEAGDGDDVIDAAGGVFDASWSNIVGDPKNDVIDGGAGTDRLIIDAGAVDETFDQVTSVERLEIVTAGTTVLQGGDADPADTRHAQTAGIVTIDAENAGDDVVDASTFSVGLTVNLGGGDDTVETGSGDDVFNVASLTDDDELVAGAGADTLNLDADTALEAGNGAFSGFETVVLGSASDGPGPDLRHDYALALDDANAPDPNVAPLDAVLTVDGGALVADDDPATFETEGEKLTLNAGAVTAFRLDVTGGGASDAIVSGQGDDSISGAAGNDEITLVAGDNLVDAGEGDDEVELGAGVDTVSLGAGSDTLVANDGRLTLDDVVDGGAGEDAIFTNASLNDVDFTQVSSIETLVVDVAGQDQTLGAEAQAAGIRSVDMTDGADTLDARDYSEGLTVRAGQGDDAITTGAGNDSIESEGGDDTIVSNDGDDRIDLRGAGDRVVSTGNGRDSVVTENGNDVIDTGDGGDLVALGVGNVDLDLGAGDDRVFIRTDLVDADAGDLTADDTIAGGAGFDRIFLDNANSETGVTAVIDLGNVTGVEEVRFGTITGSLSDVANGPGDEDIDPAEDPDDVNDPDDQTHAVTFVGGDVDTLTEITVDGRVITDTLDSLEVTFGADVDVDYVFRVFGTAGDDLFVKEGTNNNNIVIEGGDGDDVLRISGGELGANVTFDGGAGQDAIELTGGTLRDDDFVSISTGGVERLATVAGVALNASLGAEAARAGVARIEMGDDGGNVTVDAAFGNDLELVLGAGADTFDAGAADIELAIEADAGDIDGDTISGGSGDGDEITVRADGSTADLRNVDGVESYVVVENGDENIGLTFGNGSFAGVASGRISVDGSALDDAGVELPEGSLTVDAGGVTAGAFDIVAGSGDDDITTGGGNDSIDLGEGDDVVDSGAGDDTITNDGGDNTVDAGAGDDVIALGDGDNDVNAGDGADSVTLGNGANTVDAGAGDDVVTVLVPGAGEVSGDNRVDLGDGADVATLQAGDDTVFGGAGRDTIDAGDGDDVVFGGGGADVLTGGAGADAFHYAVREESLGLERDRITDFNSGEDRIVIEKNLLLQAGGVTTGVKFVGNAVDFSDAQGAVSTPGSAGDGFADAVFESANNKLWIDLNDDGQLDGRDLQIILEGVTELYTEKTEDGETIADIDVVDTIAPAAPTAIDLVAADDTGASDSDDLTFEDPLVVRVSFDGASTDGTAAVAGDNLRIFDGGGGLVVERALTPDEVANGFAEFELVRPEGETSLSARLTDADGNVSAPAEALTITVDRTAPVVPSIDAVAEDDVVNIAENGGGVTIGGTGEAGSVVELTLDNEGGGVTTFNVEVDETGVWSVDVPDLAGIVGQGETTIRVTSTDAAGNVSAEATRDVTVDTVGPNPAGISLISLNRFGAEAELTGGGDAGNTLETATILPRGVSTVFGAIDGEADALTGADLYRFTLDAETTLTIDLIELEDFGGFDPNLILFNAAGQGLWGDDDDGPGLDSRIEVTLAAGDYYVAAGSNNIDAFESEEDWNAGDDFFGNDSGESDPPTEETLGLVGWDDGPSDDDDRGTYRLTFSQPLGGDAPEFGVEENPVVVAEVDASGRVAVSVTYDEAMDTSEEDAPTVTFDPEISSTFAFAGGAWNAAGTVYTADFDITDSDVELEGVQASVSGGRDLAGNEAGGGVSFQSIDIDTVAPEVTISISNPALIVGDLTTVSFEFSEAVQGFDLGDVTVGAGVLSDLTQIGETTYTATLSPAQDVTLTTTGDGVAAAADLLDGAGLTTTVGELLDLTSEAVGALTTGSLGTFTVSAGDSIDWAFDNGDSGYDAVFAVFDDGDGEVATLLAEETVASGAFVAPADGDVHFLALNTEDAIVNSTLTISYAAGGGDAELTVLAGGWSDGAGNVAVADVTAEYVTDLTVPTVESVVVSDTVISAADSGTEVTITVTYSEAMDTTVAPSVTFAPGAPGAVLPFGVGDWTDDTTFELTATVGDVEVESGPFDVTVKAGQDKAGNVQEVQFVEDDAFVVDTLATLGTVDLVAGSDTGESDEDNTSSETAPTFRVTFTAGINAGDEVELLLGGASLGTPATATVTAADVTNGSVDITVNDGDLGADGDKSITARVTDAAGNTHTTAAPLVYDLDTTATIGAEAVDLVAASDSGSSTDDAALSEDDLSNDTSPTFEITLGADAEAGDKVELLLGGASLGTPATATLTEADITAGKVELTVTEGDLGEDGEKSVTARFTDVAGNTAVSDPLTYTLDTTPPPAPETLSVTYDNSTNTLLFEFSGDYGETDLTGGVIDLSKASWDYNGNGDNANPGAPSSFALAEGLVVGGEPTVEEGDEGFSISVQLTSGAAGGLEQSGSGFAGSVEDGFDVAAGVLTDAAGNASTFTFEDETIRLRLLGSDDPDNMFGGSGADTLTGGLGDDTLTGRDGGDLFVFEGRDIGSDLVTDFVFGEGDPEDVIGLDVTLTSAPTAGGEAAVVEDVSAANGGASGPENGLYQLKDAVDTGDADLFTLDREDVVAGRDADLFEGTPDGADFLRAVSASTLEGENRVPGEMLLTSANDAFYIATSASADPDDPDARIDGFLFLVDDANGDEKATADEIELIARFEDVDLSELTAQNVLMLGADLIV